MATKYVFVTGGVVSGLGKGITAASLGRLLKTRGLKVASQKLDPYINVDPGTMSPLQHGEVFVTDDGTETDLDLGHYERFIDENLNKYSNLTTGKVYWNVLNKERQGAYLGQTVQIIPHITNEIKSYIYNLAKSTEADVVITEIGGTTGDIESQPFLEAIRQVGIEQGMENCCYIHVVLVPYISGSDEYKSKPAQHSCKELQGMGIRVVMLTGDNERTAKAIGAQAGVDEVIAGVLPDGKEAVIRNLKNKGRVAMVGDGINDAPALTRADVGIAIGAGTDVAIDAADVVLMKSRLSDVPAAIRLSRATLHNIHENLFWAFAYNVLGIPLAAGVFIPLLHWQMNPMYGAAAMSLSSFCVVSNALRLNLFDIRSTKHDHKRKAHKTSKKENTTMNKTIKIEGMMCGHCEATVKKALEALDGVSAAEVSHTAGTAVVTLDKPVDDTVLKKAVEDKDYTVTGIE